MRLKSVEVGILVCFCALTPQFVAASEEAANQRTQAALSLDAHPDRGKAPFIGSCSSCHGAKAHGNAERAVPALAGQRFAYLIRQIADFGSTERDNTATGHIISDKQLSDPQVWSDVAGYLH
jgi:cytochrome c553